MLGSLERGGEARRGGLPGSSLPGPWGGHRSVLRGPRALWQGRLCPPPIVPGKRAEASWEPLGAMNTGGAQEP